MTKGKIFAIIIAFLCIIAVGTIAGINIYTVLDQKYQDTYNELQRLQEENAKLNSDFQKNEQSLMLLNMWYENDGYGSAEEWWTDLQNYRSGYLNCDKKVLEGENAEYATDEQKERLTEIAKSIEDSRNPVEVKALVDEFNQIVEAIDAQKNDALYQQYVATTNAYSWNGGGSSYSFTSDGLTPQSGVNYHDGRTETYYSSNVLYHYRTNEWSVDSEGFYRTDEGYYVVAASDMAQGTTFEGSKGTCIVLDSGCSEGVTDYYVKW